ncbi:MAG TPA: radical SAM/SPASM domain-containing protein [Candidatus Thermoplasmatota archaeon]|jgi:MoaA/NifB/PqqE/SkfB family radical SAM enzyme|nr:radical SAM/SPASM domain-containing protein [Candidatus Thermoplasmatota archaeon]
MDLARAVDGKRFSNVDLDFTKQCNLRCKHCYADAGPAEPDELTTAELTGILDQCADLGTLVVTVGSGGEAMLRPDLFEVLAHGRARGLIMFLVTNGLLVTPDTAARLRELRVVASVSLDGATAASHDGLRGPSAFEGALRGVRTLRSAGAITAVNLTLNKLNYHEMPRFLALARELGVKYVSVNRMLPVGRGRLHANLITNGAEFKQAVHDLRAHMHTDLVMSSQDPILDRMFKTATRAPGEAATGVEVVYSCTAGLSSFAVKANGDVVPCRMIPVPVGNVRRATLAQIWDGARFGQEKDRLATIGPGELKPGDPATWGGCKAVAYFGAPRDPLQGAVRELLASERA